MKIFAHLHGYPPVHNAGAEWMLHSILRWMAGRGHEVRVYSLRNKRPATLDGVELIGLGRSARLQSLHQWADVSVTHLDLTAQAMHMAGMAHTPLVHIVHNDQQLAYHAVERRNCALAVMNSQWLADKIAWNGPQIIVRPPVERHRFPVHSPGGQEVTLINLNAEKGAHLFWRVAELMPQTRFLGVRGSYGSQIVPAILPGNATVIDNTPDMVRDVYARTRILLVPSVYESWGRVAVEAMSSGIPVIAHPTPGLKESLGSAGIFVDRLDVQGWIRAINRFKNKTRYYDAANDGLQRVVELDPEPELLALEARMLELATPTLDGMECRVCGTKHATCGGPSEVGNMLEVLPSRRRGNVPKRLYRVGTTVMKLSAFRAQQMGAELLPGQEPLVDDQPPTETPEIEHPDPPTDAPNKARRTRQRGRVVAP